MTGPDDPVMAEIGAAVHLADVHRRLGHDGRARQHLDRAEAAIGALPDDGYGRMIRAGIVACGERLAAGDRGARAG